MDAWSLTYFIFSTVFFKTNINWHFTLKQKVDEPDTLKSYQCVLITGITTMSVRKKVGVGYGSWLNSIADVHQVNQMHDKACLIVRIW